MSSPSKAHTLNRCGGEGGQFGEETDEECTRRDSRRYFRQNTPKVNQTGKRPGILRFHIRNHRITVLYYSDVTLTPAHRWCELSNTTVTLNLLTTINISIFFRIAILLHYEQGWI